jgi:hypothetical protein
MVMQNPYFSIDDNIEKPKAILNRKLDEIFDTHKL